MPEQSTLFIDNAPFLGRIEEQQRYREALREVLQQNSIAAKAKRVLSEPDGLPLPFVFLLYGEGGMGKSTLAKQLRHIATTETEFKGHFEALWLDWEARKQLDLKLVARESVSPETVFKHIYAIFRDANFGKEFDAYEKALTTRAEAEKKVAQVLDETASEGRDRYGALRELGANGLAWLVRSGLVGGTSLPIPQEPMAKAFEAILGGSAEALARARDTVTTLLRSRLDPDEFDLFTLPNETLARKLADGIWKVAQKKPIVLTLDTYEIADRADVWLRVVIKRAGPNVIWVIAGRDSLAESRKYGQGYQPGYRADFTSDRLRVFSMDEFSVSDVAEYFKYRVPERPLDKITAQTIHQAALGIPLAVKEAAAIWQNPAKTLTDIAGDSAPSRDRDKIVQTMTERFLLHCWDDPQDRTRLYALAMAYQPDADLLSAMLDTQDLEAELSELERRHSFVFVTDMKLHDKVSIWIREYLQAEVHRKIKNVRDLHQRAVQHLRERSTQQETLLPLLEDRMSEERWTTDTAALTYHSFWLDEVQGWMVLLPTFVGGLGYNRDFARVLLDAAQSLTRTLSKTGQRRLKALRAGLYGSPDATQQGAALDELESTQNSWPKDGGEAERRAILDLYRGQVYYRERRYMEALERYGQAEQNLPKLGNALKQQLGRALNDLAHAFIWPKEHLHSRYSPEAAQIMSKVIAWLPEDPRAWFDFASTLAFTDRTKAIAAFQHAIQLDTDLKITAVSYGRLGGLYLSLRRTDEAIDAYERAIEIDPEYAGTHSGLGDVYRHLSRMDDAISEYMHAIDLDPKYIYSYIGLGYTYHSLGRNAEAIRQFQHIIELDQDISASHLGLGYIYSTLGRIDEAIAEYQCAIELDPNNAYSHSRIGFVYRQVGRINEAIAEYQRAIELDPSNAHPHNGIGFVYRQVGRINEAIAEYQRAIELDPTLAWPHNNLGDVYRELGRANDAITEYRHAIELDSKFTRPHYSLGNVYRNLDRFDDAFTEFQRAIELDPKDAFSRIYLVDMLKRFGREAEAAEHEKIARELIGKENEYNRACFEAICGNADEALDLLKAALEKKQQSRAWARRDPDFESLRHDPRFIALIGEADELPSVDAATSE